MEHTIGVIHEEDGNFGISFPDFPGAISTGGTLDEVLRKGAQALALHIEGMVEDGTALPRLRSLAEIRRDEAADIAGALLVAVPVELPGKAVRVNISLDERLLDRIDKAAQAAGQSRSAFLVEAAKRRMAG